MILAVIILSCCVVALATYLVIRRRKTEKQLDAVIDYLMKVQDRNTLPEIEGQAEGKLKILQSETYKLATMLQEQYSRETEKNRYLADMLSNISHQIKTPLTAITLMTDLLKSDSLTESERRQCLSRIVGQTDRITWLIRTLLTLAQLDAGVLTLKQETVDAANLIDSIYDSLAVVADVKGVELRKDIPEDVQLLCDAHWTQEALSNIIKNSLEHTPEGGSVTVRVSQSNLATDIVISDTGSGISQKDLPHIFDRFYRGENADANRIGIGLALSKQIIVSQNGTIDVKSQEGLDSTFSIRLYRTQTV